MTSPAHYVKALCSDGWVGQACSGPIEACRLFDRLRAKALTPLQRVAEGRVVEVYQPPVDRRTG